MKESCCFLQSVGVWLWLWLKPCLKSLEQKFVIHLWNSLISYILQIKIVFSRMAHMPFWENCQRKWVLRHFKRICPITLWRSWSNAALLCPNFCLFSLLHSLPQPAEKQKQSRQLSQKWHKTKEKQPDWGTRKNLMVRLSALDWDARDILGNCGALVATEQAREDTHTIIRKQVSYWTMLNV